MKQRHVSRLAREHAEADDTQIRALALPVSASCQLSRRRSGDVRVEGRRIEYDAIRPELESQSTRSARVSSSWLRLPWNARFTVISRAAGVA